MFKNQFFTGNLKNEEKTPGNKVSECYVSKPLPMLEFRHVNSISEGMCQMGGRKCSIFTEPVCSCGERGNEIQRWLITNIPKEIYCDTTIKQQKIAWKVPFWIDFLVTTRNRMLQLLKKITSIQVF